MHLFQNFGLRDVLGQMQKTYQASYILPSDFLDHFS